MVENFDEEINRLLNETTEYLNEVEYPADKGDLLAAAKSRDAPPEVVAVLEQLPEKTYRTHNDLVALFVDTDGATGGGSQGNGVLTSFFRGYIELVRQS